MANDLHTISVQDYISSTLPEQLAAQSGTSDAEYAVQYTVDGTQYAIKAVRAAASKGEGESAGRLECQWQRQQLPEAIRELVLDDQRLRNDICWAMFDC